MDGQPAGRGDGDAHLGDRLARLRRLAGLTQEQVAERSGHAARLTVNTLFRRGSLRLLIRR